ncbi:hypothetical protein ABE178_16330 [Priestia megaterium]
MQIKQQVWYRSVKVPTRSYNKGLGLNNIKVFPANPHQRTFGIVCNCVLELVCGSVRVTIGESKHNPGTLYLATPGQDKIVDHNTGEITYYENVNLNYELKAQVLKYVESLTE